MINTKCPECQTQLGDREADITAGLLRCPGCGKELSLMETALEIEDKAYKKVLREVEGIDIQRGNGLLIHIMPQTSGNAGGVLLFGLVMLLPVVLVGLLAGAKILLWLPVVLLFVIVGLLAITRGIKRLGMHTWIQVDHQMLQFRYSLFDSIPIGQKQFPVSEVSQFFVKQINEGSAGAKDFIIYVVKVLLKNGREQPLVRSLRKADYAFFIERELERFLKIEDRILPGEYPASEGHSIKTTEDENKWWAALNVEAREKTFIHLSCETCGKPLDDAIVNADANMVQCRECKSVEVLDTIQFSTKNAEAWLKKVKAPPMAKNITMIEGKYLELIFKPPFFGPGSDFMGLWLMGLVAGLFTVLVMMGTDRVQVDWSGSPGYNVIAILIGGWCLWLFVRRLGLSRVIEVHPTQLIRCDKLFGSDYAPKLVLKRAEFDQIFVKQRDFKSDEPPRYELYARLNNGKEYLILKDLTEAAQAYYLEHKIEVYLGIEDKQVENEYRPAFNPGMEGPINLMDAYKLVRTFIRKLN